MMCKRVLFPAPEAPDHRNDLSPFHIERDAAQDAELPIRAPPADECLRHAIDGYDDFSGISCRHESYSQRMASTGNSSAAFRAGYNDASMLKTIDAHETATKSDHRNSTGIAGIM